MFLGCVPLSVPCIIACLAEHCISYEFSDNRIESVSVVLADDDATTYLAKNDGNLTDDPKKVVISKKEGAVILTPPTCKVNVNILDKWGRTKSVSIYVKVNK